MLKRNLVTAHATIHNAKRLIINALLGYTGRAGRIISDSDAHLIGMVPQPIAFYKRPKSPFFNHDKVMTSQPNKPPTP